MSEKMETKKFTLTVEGETEMWYFNWLQDQINASPERKYNVSIDVKKQQSPKKFFKGLNAKTTPKVIHICDVESNEPRTSMPIVVQTEGCASHNQNHI